MVAELALLDGLVSLRSHIEVLTDAVYFVRLTGDDPHGGRGILMGMMRQVCVTAEHCRSLAETLFDCEGAPDAEAA